MNGVVSLLDEQHHRVVEDMWAELAERFGLRGVYATPYPHFSYQIAPQYDAELLKSILEDVAARQTVFHVQTTGLGIFTGAQPVLYIPVVRSLQLTQFQQLLWNELASASQDASEYYHPDRWMPHITISFSDLDKSRLADVIVWLSERPFHWTIEINNLAYIDDTGAEQLLRLRCALRA